MPRGGAARGDWRIGSGVSIAVHLALLLLLISPAFLTPDPVELAQGAGGPGPAGGGGGGAQRGEDRTFRRELLRFVQVVAAPARVAATPPPVPPPKIAPKPIEVEEPRVPEQTVASGSSAAGVGRDTTGAGPGSGGGTGSGAGTGTGTAVGPGTGGGDQANYPPTPIEMFIPPLPVPNSVKGFHLVAEFDVDERGRVLSLTFTQTRDRAYNRRLEEVLKSFRFRPGTRPDGTPVRMKAQVVVDLY